jgi:hypothetical protein
MTRPKDRENRTAVKRPASSRFVRSELEQVMRDVEAVIRVKPRQMDPIVEQLKQCPEVFKAGEMIGKMLDSLKYSQGNDVPGDRYLPPAGAVIPPLA